MLLTPEPKAKEDAPVGVDMRTSGSPSRTCTQGAFVGRATDGGIRSGAPVPTSMTTGVGDGMRGSMASASSADALDVPPNSKTEAGDRPAVGGCSTAPSPSSTGGDAMSLSYSCSGQATHPCAGHHNGGGGGSCAGSTSTTPSIGAAVGGARGWTAGVEPFARPAPLRLWLRRPRGSRTPWRCPR
jgi:hypothetical protein